MSGQGQLGLGEPGEERVTRSYGAVTSTTDCGTAGALRVELVLVERHGQSDVEVVRLVEGNRVTTIPMDTLDALLRGLSRAKDSSERRKARRGKP